MYFPIGLSPKFQSVHRSPMGMSTVACLLLTAVMLIATTPVFAERGVPLTLAEAEKLAVTAEPGQQALHAQAQALEESAIAAGALPDPVLRVGLNNYPIQSGDFRTEGMTNAALGLRQVFPAGHTRDINTRRFGLLANEKHANADVRGRNVLNAVRVVWLDLYYWNQAHDLVSESRPFFNDLAIITRSLYAVGRNSQQDVLRAELELSRLDDRLIELERQRAGAQAGLGEWLGLDAIRPVARKLPSWNQVPALESMLDRVASHPALLAADARVDAQKADVELAEQRSRPEWAVDLAYSYREGYLASGEPRSDFISLGVTVGLPFFRRKAVDSTLSAALANRSAAASMRKQISRSLHSQLAAEHARWHDLSRRLSLYDSQILNQAKDYAEASLLAYQSDQGDFSDVMRAYIDDLNTRIDYIRLQVERAQTYAALANLGGLPR